MGTRGRFGSTTIWYGTPDETRRLQAAIHRHCTCTRGMLGTVVQTCSAHEMILDQRVLDHLLFVYRTREQFQRAERSDERGDSSGVAVGNDSDGWDDGASKAFRSPERS